MVCSRGLDGEEGTDIEVAAAAVCLNRAASWASVTQTVPAQSSSVVRVSAAKQLLVGGSLGAFRLHTRVGEAIGNQTPPELDGAPCPPAWYLPACVKEVAMGRCFGALIILTLVGAVAHAGSKQDITDCSDWSAAKISEVERIEVCTRALKASKMTKEERAGMHFSRAQAYAWESRHAEAVADLDQAIAINPGNDLRSKYLRYRAFSLYMSEDYDKAIAAYDQLLSEAPADASFFHFRGLSFLKKGDAARGFADFDQVVALEPNDPQSYVWRGDAYVERGESQKALSDFDKAIALKPDHGDAYFKRAMAYEERGDFDKLADLTRVTEINPDRQPGFLRRAVLHERLGNVGFALADYEKLLSLAPDEQFYRSRRDALLQTMTAAPALSPSPKITAPLTTAPSAPEDRAPVAAASPLGCKVFVPAANLTVSIPCAQ